MKQKLSITVDREYNKGLGSALKNILVKSTDWYFRPKSFEKSGKPYKGLGIKYFKKICDTIGKIFGKNPTYSNNYRLWDKSKKGLQKFEKWTRINEVFHILFIIPTANLAIKKISEEDYAGATISTLCFLIGAYSIMTQRYNRNRLYNVIEYKEQKAK